MAQTCTTWPDLHSAAACMWWTFKAMPAGHVSGQSPSDIVVEQQPCPWLDYLGRWGSTVEAPALQEWFAKAEHPISRTWLQQVCGKSFLN